jgi:hypothetical protein
MCILEYWDTLVAPTKANKDIMAKEAAETIKNSTFNKIFCSWHIRDELGPELLEVVDI